MDAIPNFNAFRVVGHRREIVAVVGQRHVRRRAPLPDTLRKPEVDELTQRRPDRLATPPHPALDHATRGAHLSDLLKVSRHPLHQLSEQRRPRHVHVGRAHDHPDPASAIRRHHDLGDRRASLIVAAAIFGALHGSAARSVAGERLRRHQPVGRPIDRRQLPLRPDRPPASRLTVLHHMVEDQHRGSTISQPTRRARHPRGDLAIRILVQHRVGERLTHRVEHDQSTPVRHVSHVARQPAADNSEGGLDVREPAPAERVGLDAELHQATHRRVEPVLPVQPQHTPAIGEDLRRRHQGDPRLSSAGLAGQGMHLARVEQPGTV